LDKAPVVVALVCDAMYPHSHGGRELRYQALLPRLAEQVDMYVYTMHWWDGPKVYTENGVTFHAISRLLPMYTRGRRSTRQALIFGFACFFLLGSKFDIIDADQIPYFQLFALRLVATLKGKPLVATWHEVWGRSYWRDYLGWIGWIAWLVELVAMRLPDHIIAASTQTAERLCAAIGENASITTVPNGMDMLEIASVPPSDRRVDIIAVGRLIEHKRIGALLEVVAALHARYVPVTCRIIGDGPERSALKRQARLLGIGSSVEFLHDVTDQTELYSLIKGARLFASLSTREGFGIAVLEAIACGTRVLTTTAPDNLALHLVQRYSRGVVCGPTVAEITDTVHEILLHADSGEDIAAADPWVEEYDWGTMVDRVMQIYSDAKEPLLHGSMPLI